MSAINKGDNNLFHSSHFISHASSRQNTVTVIHISPSFVLPLHSFSFPSLQILMSALRGSTTAERTPCASTPLVPLCASATRATSGSMTIPAQVSSSAGLLTGWNQVEKALSLFWLHALRLLVQPFYVGIWNRQILQVVHMRMLFLLLLLFGFEELYRYSRRL